MTAKKDGYRAKNRQLTSKQKELLPYLAQDKSDTDISTALGISVFAVAKRIERMIDAVKCTDRFELVEYAKEYAKIEESRSE